MGHPPCSPDLALFLPINLAGRDLSRSSGKNGKSPKGNSKTLVPELLPAMTAPIAEVCDAVTVILILLFEALGPEKSFETLGPEKSFEALGPEKSFEALEPEKSFEALEPEKS
ncbi:hypothetical protein TNCV_46591 [Trichonephila clavipes]|nr:hypothetical protein TNCV_46591 [Trichonephila clavipes]